MFGLADDPLAGAAVRDTTGRGTVVLTGLETDVCVAHSALGLLDSGHRVVVVEDAVVVTAPRMAPASTGCGARESFAVTKQLHYEWMRSRTSRASTRIPGWPSRRACSCNAAVCAPTARSPGTWRWPCTPHSKGV